MSRVKRQRNLILTCNSYTYKGSYKSCWNQHYGIYWNGDKKKNRDQQIFPQKKWNEIVGWLWLFGKKGPEIGVWQAEKPIMEKFLGAGSEIALFPQKNLDEDLDILWAKRWQCRSFKVVKRWFQHWFDSLCFAAKEKFYWHFLVTTFFHLATEKKFLEVYLSSKWMLYIYKNHPQYCGIKQSTDLIKRIKKLNIRNYNLLTKNRS